MQKERSVIPNDIKRYVARRFAESEQEEALTLLETAAIHDGSAANERLLRCAVVAGSGSIERLRVQIETLKRDFRDVIVAGEYTPRGRELVRTRNLNEPIPDEDAH